MYQTSWRDFDWPLLLAVLALLVVGGIMIYSSYEASAPAGAGTLWENAVFRQGLFGLGGIMLLFAATALDYHVLLRMHRWVLLAAVLILGITLLIGQTSFGAQSWIALSSFGGQPSELSKVLIIVVLARTLGKSQEELESIKVFALSLLLVTPAIVLIYLQPDAGTALVLAATWLGMVFLAGVRWRHLIALALAGLIAAPVVWFRIEGYMRDRFIDFIYPERDPSGSSYNTTQALISIGSGGLWGKGLLKGTQSQLHFLRVRHTDFIFSVLAEEMGFVGALLLLALFAFIVLRLVRIAMTARDRSGQLLAGGVAVMIVVQAIINLGFNTSLLPVTGLPLPLVSYGGSSLTNTLLAIGLAQSVAIRRRARADQLLRHGARL